MPRPAKYPFLVRQGSSPNWHARLIIPEPLRSAFGGRHEFRQSTRLSDPRHAADVGQRWLDEWRAEIQAARFGQPVRSPQEIAKAVRAAQAAEDAGTHTEVLAQAIALVRGMSGEQWLNAFIADGYDPQVALAKALGADAAGEFKGYIQAPEPGTPFLHYIDDFRTMLERTRSGSTHYEYTNDVEKFAKFQPEGLTLEAFAPDHVQRYINHRAAQKGRSGTFISPKTVIKELSGVRKYWGFVSGQDGRKESLGKLNPFAGIKMFEHERPKYDPNAADFTTEAEDVRYTPMQVTQLYRAALKRGDCDLADFIAIMAFTGARREGVARLHVKTINLQCDHPHLWFWEKDKPRDTELTMRRVPIHRLLRNIIARRVATAHLYDGFLFEGSVNAKGLRGTILGQRLARLITREKMAVDGLGSHGFRRTFIQFFADAGTAEHIPAKLVGHKLKSMTYGRYASVNMALDVATDIMSTLIKYQDWPLNPAPAL